jgi:hypothetical protein
MSALLPSQALRQVVMRPSAKDPFRIRWSVRHDTRRERASMRRPRTTKIASMTRKVLRRPAVGAAAASPAATSAGMKSHRVPVK